MKRSSRDVWSGSRLPAVASSLVVVTALLGSGAAARAGPPGPAPIEPGAEREESGGIDLAAVEEGGDLTDLGLENLVELEVTSVAKKPQRLADAPAAVFVLTGEEIRRSGVTSLQDALRLVPGVQVARIDANKYAISARGFNGRFSNKLLVLIDGRTVYTPLWSGVYWEQQDLLLEDVDRIEVVRGPGGTIWGANAVNGVINVITKHPRDTQGLLAGAGAGSEERFQAVLRYGGKVGDEFQYRVWGKYFDRDEGFGGHDDWRLGTFGFRGAWTPTDRDEIHLHAGGFSGGTGDESDVPSFASPFSTVVFSDNDQYGGYGLARWERALGESSSFDLQAFYQRTHFEGQNFAEDRDTADLELQHRFALPFGQDLVWGLGYRASIDAIDSSSAISMEPAHRNLHLVSGFLQDEIELVEEALFLTLGTKLEHHTVANFEVQPSARLLWRPAERHTLWTSVSRAVRTPSRAEQDVRYTLRRNATTGGFSRLVGNRDVEPEDVCSFEVGYRGRPRESLTLDIAAYWNLYNDLMSSRVGTPFLETSPGPAHLVIPLDITNDLDGEGYGIELAGRWQPVDWWRFDLSYSWARLFIHPGSNKEGSLPRHQVSARSGVDLPFGLELDAALRFVDELPARAVPSYVALDLKLGWQKKLGDHEVEVSLSARNLLDSHHPEFTDSLIFSRPTEVQSGVFGQVVWRFP